MSLFQSFFQKRQLLDSLDSHLYMHSPIPSLLTDIKSQIIQCNYAFEDLSNYSQQELHKKPTTLLKSNRHDHLFYIQRWKKLQKHGEWRGQVWYNLNNQSELLLQEHIQKISYKNHFFYQYTFSNITEDQKQIERYRYLAMHDPLTGLANRALAKDRFIHALQSAKRSDNNLGILLCDLNEFKQVNDQYGHHIGDLLLIKIANQLSSLVRNVDTVARIGGDEFLIIVEHIQSKQTLEHLVSKIKQHFSNNTFIDNISLNINISIGTAMVQHDDISFEEILRVADIKMYDDKKLYYSSTTTLRHFLN